MLSLRTTSVVLAALLAAERADAIEPRRVTRRHRPPNRRRSQRWRFSNGLGVGRGPRASELGVTMMDACDGDTFNAVIGRAPARATAA